MLHLYLRRRRSDEADSRDLAGWMCDIIDSMEGADADEKVINRVLENVRDICTRLPVYG